MPPYKGGTAKPALNEQQLFHLALSAGFPADKATVMAQIALKESSGIPNNTHKNADGTIDHGLWMINDVHKPGPNWDDPQANAVMAYKVYAESKRGFRPWSVCTDAACSNLAGKGNLKPDGVPKTNPNGADPYWPDDINPITAVPNAIKGAAHVFTDTVTNGINSLTSTGAKIAGSMIMLTLAVIFVVLGILLISGRSVVRELTSAKKKLPI